MAILLAPGENSSRYVFEGQYVADGRVLVKRIDMNREPEPVVVLEEIGMEVVKPLNQQEPITPIATEDSTQLLIPTAGQVSSIPLPPPPPEPFSGALASQ
ncbi:hypothetical protein [Rubidibacter lacunae]|nr:hypothetical protein [Rubidibacter lacunae]